MTPEQEKRFKEITERLSKIKIGEPFDDVDRRKSSLALIKEYQRRVWHCTNGHNQWFLIQKDQDNISQNLTDSVTDFMSEIRIRSGYIDGWMNAIIDKLIIWYVLCDASNGCHNPQKPLIRLLERGVTFRRHHGFYEISYSNYTMSFSHTNIEQVKPLLDLSDEALNELDKEKTE